jgi:hypothetical protein
MSVVGLGSEAGLGTRFWIFPQAPYVPGYQKPDLVWISTPPDRLRPGPADDRMYVVDPALDKLPYEFPLLPPYAGLTYPPAEAGPDGHFDHLSWSSRQFLSAHAFACARRVLDIWESYLGEPIVWHFARDLERLEITPRLDWPNAQSGYGFLELGLERTPDGRENPFALNFDVIAHEVGHAILFSLFGTPDTITESEFAAFHEASADLVSLISFLHFRTGTERLLRRTQGNILTENELNRIAELDEERQFRLASNSRRQSEVTAEIHDRSRPFTGGIFDTLVELYHLALVERGLADERLLEIDIRQLDPWDIGRITEETRAAFSRSPFLFAGTLETARDIVGTLLVRTWAELDPSILTFRSVAESMVEQAESSRWPVAAQILEGNFVWREIF